MRTLIRDLGTLLAVVFLQYVVLNVLPMPFNQVDLFATVAGLYALYRPPRRALAFAFVGSLVMEAIYPANVLLGDHTLVMLVLTYLLIILNNRLVMRGAAAVIMIGLYAVLVPLGASLLATLLGLPFLVPPTSRYLVLFVGTAAIAGVLLRKFDVQ